jgi:ribose transport system permease protein
VLPQGFIRINTLSIAGVPIPAVYAIVLAFALWIMSERLPLGRYVYAIGATEKAAALNGIPVRAYVIGVFVASGLITGFAGCVLAAKLRIGQANVGLDYLLPVSWAHSSGRPPSSRGGSISGARCLAS